LLRALHEHPLTAGCYPTAMGYYPKAFGHSMRREKHDDNLLILCTEGQGSVDTGSRQFAVKPGDTVILPRGVGHAYHSDENDPWTLYWVHFMGKDAPTFLSHLRGEDEYCIHSGVEPSLLAGFEQMLAVDTTGYRMDAFIAAANRLRHLLAEFALCRDRQRGEKTGSMRPLELQAFMRERLRGSLSLAELAAFSGLTPQHFAMRYKSETGYSPMRHFLHMKMEAACRLLDSTGFSVKAVASHLGYADPLYFSRVFRQTVGLSPTQYRESQRG
jgi:AraC-like DNA-binding protein